MYEQTKSQELAANRSFQIEINDHYTLNEIVAIHGAQETSIQRTPHTGNINLSHILHFELGLPAVLYDRNKGKLDGTFHPHMVVNQNGAEQISADDVLMTHARIDTPHNLSEDHSDLFPLGSKVADAHTQAIRRIFPDVNISQYSEYLSENNQFVNDILQVVSRHYEGDLWKRWVEPDGNTKTMRPETNTDAATQIYGVNDEEKGWIIANQINVLLMAAVEAKKYGTDRVYHVSGPDMYRYIDDMKGELDYLYSTVREKLPQHQLPRRLEFVVVPMANIRFVTHEQKSNATEELVSMWPVYKTMLQEKKDFFIDLRSSDKEKEEKAEETKNYIRDRERPVLDAIQAQCKTCPELFFDTSQKSHLTQYDLLNGYGHNLKIPKTLLDMPIKEINEMYKAYEKISSINLK